MNRYDQRMRELKKENVGAYQGCQPIRSTEEEIQAVEAILGTILPSDYREFVRDYGNYWVRGTFPLQKNAENVQPGGVAVFFGIIGQQHENSKHICGWTDIVESYHGLCGEEGYSEEWLPIANGDGSDFYVLAFKGEDKGTIHYITDASLRPTFKIARSFDEFIHLIVPYVDEE